jgi:hypothetical protein
MVRAPQSASYASAASWMTDLLLGSLPQRIGNGRISRRESQPLPPADVSIDIPSTEPGELLGRDPQETITYIARVDVPSRDHPRGVDAIRESVRFGFRGARRVEGGDSTVAGSDEAVNAAGRVKEGSCDRPRGVDGAGIGFTPRTRDIERC